MKKQINMFVLSGVLISSFSVACFAQGNTEVYSSTQGQPTVYKIYRKPAVQSSDNSNQQSNDNRGYETTYQQSNVYVSKNGSTVYQAQIQDVEVQPAYNTPAVASSNMPPVIDMRQSQPQQQVYNQPQQSYQNTYTAPPAPNNNAKAVHSINGTQLYGAKSNNRYSQAAPANNYNNNYNYSRTNRNRQLDYDLSNRPNAYTVVDEMYTPEYRAMMSGDPNYKQYNSDYYTEGEMTFVNGQIENVGPYQPQPLPGYQHHEYVAPPQPRVASVQTYVTPPVAPQQNAGYSQNTNRPAPQPQQQVMSGDVVYFKNGAKLSGKVLSLDESLCQFRMTNGNVANYSTADILKIEKY